MCLPWNRNRLAGSAPRWHRKRQRILRWEQVSPCAVLCALALNRMPQDRMALITAVAAPTAAAASTVAAPTTAAPHSSVLQALCGLQLWVCPTTRPLHNLIEGSILGQTTCKMTFMSWPAVYRCCHKPVDPRCSQQQCFHQQNPQDMALPLYLVPAWFPVAQGSQSCGHLKQVALAMQQLLCQYYHHQAAGLFARCWMQWWLCAAQAINCLQCSIRLALTAATGLALER